MVPFMEYPNLTWMAAGGTTIYENHHMETDMMGVLVAFHHFSLVIFIGRSESQPPNMVFLLP